MSDEQGWAIVVVIMATTAEGWLRTFGFVLSLLFLVADRRERARAGDGS